MNCAVHLVVRETTTVVANLILIKSPATLRFVNDDDSVIFSDSLDVFNSLKLNPSNPRQYTLFSELGERKFTFQRDIDSSRFLKILSGDMNYVTGTPNDPYSFTVSIPEQRSILEVIYNHLTGDTPQPTIRDVDGFTFGTIDKDLPSDELASLTKEDVLARNGQHLMFSTLDIPRELFPIIFDYLLPVRKGAQTEYYDIKRQWQLTSEAQWHHNQGMREFVYKTEEWMKKDPNISHREIFFNVCMSLFTFFFGQIKVITHEQIMVLVRVMQCAFLTDDVNRDGSVIGCDGNAYVNDDAESMVFWHTKELIDKWVTANFIPLKESLAIRSALSSISHSTSEMLNDRSITSFDFAFREAGLLFGRGRGMVDLLLLTASAISSGNIALFRQNGIVASLVLLQRELQEIPVSDTTEFYSTYRRGLARLNTRTLIYNIEKLFSMNVIQHA